MTTPRKKTATRKPAPRKQASRGRVTPPKPKPAEPRLVVSKVLVQPVLVLVDGNGDAQEVQHPVIEIKGADWAKWASGAFTPTRLEELRQSITPITAE